MNWGVLVAPWDAREVAEFVNALDRVNAVAERSPGFLWRMPNDEMEAEQALMAEIGPTDRLASTLSVWESTEALDHFVHQTIHGAFLGRRAAWFEPLSGPSYAIWPIPAGHRPTVAEAMAARTRLAADGPSDAAYDFAYHRARRDAA
jgi:hypothetical protein